jgi:cobalamin biosynthesis protein CobD/CbiB
MIDELPIPETPEKEVPRWVQVLVGLVLALLTLFCGFASVTMLVVPNEKSPILTVVVGLIMLLGCFWVRKVLSFVNRPQESRRPDDSEHAASGVVLLSRFPGRGLIHWLLSEDGSDCDISSSDVFLQLSGASCVGSKARG